MADTPNRPGLVTDNQNPTTGHKAQNVQLYVLNSNGYPVPVDGATTADGSNAGLVVSNELTLTADAGGNTDIVSASGAAASTDLAAVTAATIVLVTPVGGDVFFRGGAASPTATTAADMYLLDGNTYRVAKTATHNLSFITSGAAVTVYVTAEN